MNDPISRQAAIKEVEGLPDCPNGFSDTYDKACFIGILEELPTNDFTENEKKILSMLFKILNEIIETSGGYLDIDGESFGRNELFYLSEKIGVDY